MGASSLNRQGTSSCLKTKSQTCGRLLFFSTLLQPLWSSPHQLCTWSLNNLCLLVKCANYTSLATLRMWLILKVIVSTLYTLTCSGAENFDTLSGNTIGYSRKLLQKNLQAEVITLGSHLYFCKSRRQGQQVMTEFRKAEKIRYLHD